MHPGPSHPSSIWCLTKPPEAPPSPETGGGCRNTWLQRHPYPALAQHRGLWARGLPQVPSSTYVLGTTPIFFWNPLAFSFPNSLFPYTASSYTECERHCSLHKQTEHKCDVSHLQPVSLILGLCEPPGGAHWPTLRMSQRPRETGHSVPEARDTQHITRHLLWEAHGTSFSPEPSLVFL